jgi:hypothetical protein
VGLGVAILLLWSPISPLVVSPVQAHPRLSQSAHQTTHSSKISWDDQSFQPVHSLPVHYDPAPNAVLCEPPTQVQITFSEHVNPDISKIVVFWRTHSADDGHIAGGSYIFHIARADGTVPPLTATQRGAARSTGGRWWKTRLWYGYALRQVLEWQYCSAPRYLAHWQGPYKLCRYPLPALAPPVGCSGVQTLMQKVDGLTVTTPLHQHILW